MEKILKQLNKELKKAGMLQIAVVDPNDCLPQQVNARFFTEDMFDQLVENIKKDGTLESLPLVYQDEELKAEGKYLIISGHHRVDAAKSAGLPKIMVLVREQLSKEEIISKQIAHNALSGTDDRGILKNLYNEIKEIELKVASGYQFEVINTHHEALKKSAGTFKTLILLMAPDDIKDFDAAVEELLAITAFSDEDSIRVISAKDHDKLLKTLKKIKKLENIKNTTVAFHRIIELAYEKLEEREKINLGV